MKSLKINTISNILTKMWSMVSIYIFIPLYIRILGETAYGLVSFFATLQTTLNLLGLGLSNTLNREFAVGLESKDNNIRKYKLMRSIEVIYFFLGLLIICLCSFGSSFIADTWLNIESLDKSMVAQVITLMGISIALQLLANIYAGCMFGLNKQVSANLICIIWSMGKSVGSLLIIMYVMPNLVYFYSWHILMDILYLIVLRCFTVKELKLSPKPKWKIKDFANIKSIWKYTCGILFISFIALINKQLDKVIISKFLTLTELGAYNVATTLGSLTSIIPAALYTAVFPRFTNYVTVDNTEELRSEFFKTNKIVSIILSCMGAYIAIYALPLIEIWTGSDKYVSILGNVGTIVVLAVALIEYQEIPYALALANGNTRYNVMVGAIFVPIIVVSTYIGIRNFGLLGAGVVYFVTMFGQTCVYQYLVYKNYVTKKPVHLIIKDTLIPLSICLIIAFISKITISTFTSNAFIQSGLAIICGALSLCVILLIFAKEEIDVFKRVTRRK